MQNEVEFNYRNILKQVPDESELNKLAIAAGTSIKDLINKKSQVFRKLSIDLQNIEDKDIVKIIQENPRILKRPLILKDNNVLIGFNEDEYKTRL